MMSAIAACRACISLLIPGLVLAVLVLLSLALWYLVMLAILQVAQGPPATPGSVLPGQEVVNASALSTGEADRAWRAGQ
jgi:hypothetical protein